MTELEVWILRFLIVFLGLTGVFVIAQHYIDCWKAKREEEEVEEAEL